MGIEILWALMVLVGVVPARASVSWKQLVGPNLDRHVGIQQQDTLVDAATARLSGARSGYFPQLSAVTQMTQQESTLSTGSGIGAAVAPSTQILGKLVLTQNLFRGGRDRSLELASRHSLNASVFDREAYRRNLFATLIQLWGECRIATEEEAALMRWRDLARSRQRALSERIRLGRSRIVDQQALEVQDDAVQAQIVGLRSDRSRCEGEVSKILPIESIPAWESDFELPAQWKDAVLNTGRKPLHGPELGAMRSRETQARESMAVQKAGHWPTVDVVANAYLLRPGVLKDVNWDVMLQFTLPIFQGGAVSSKVEEAAQETRRQEVLQLEWIRNRLVTGAQLEQQIMAREQQVVALKAAWAKSQRLAQSLQRDSQLGLATTLDWIQAEQNALETSRQWLRTLVQWKVTWMQWRWTVGELVPFEPAELPNFDSGP